MIDIDDVYSMEWDARQWVLRTQTGTVTKEDSPNYREPTYKYTYHANLQQIANTIIKNLDTSTIKTLTELLEMYSALVTQVTSLLTQTVEGDSLCQNSR